MDLKKKITSCITLHGCTLPRTRGFLPVQAHILIWGWCPPSLPIWKVLHPMSSNNRNVYFTMSDHHRWMHSSWSTKRKRKTSLHFQEVEKIKCHIMRRDRGNLLCVGWALCLKHHLISHITIMLLAVLISRRRTLLSTPVWDVFARLFCLKSNRRAGEERTLLFYCEHERNLCFSCVALDFFFSRHNFKSNIWSNYRCTARGQKQINSVKRILNENIWVYVSER